MPDTLGMDEGSQKQTPPTLVSTRFRDLCSSVTNAQPLPPASFVSLVAMQESDPFARQDLAMQLQRDFGLARAIQASYQAMASREDGHPISSRDVVDYWGYRATHSTAVLTSLLGYLGPEAMVGPNRDFWLCAAAIATYAGLLGDVLKLHADEAFTASLLRSTALFLLQQRIPAEAQTARDLAESTCTPLWEAEAELLGGSHLDLARSLSEHWGLPGSLLPAFDATHPPDSLADLIVRSIAAAERHGFHAPNGAIVPPHLRPEREPIADAYFRNGGGTPEAFTEYISGMFGLTELFDLDSAA